MLRRSARGDVAGVRVLRHEAAGGRVVVPGAEVLQTQRLVVLFAAVAEVVGRGAGRAEQIAESIVGVTVDAGAGRLGQLRDAAHTVVAVETSFRKGRDDARSAGSIHVLLPETGIFRFGAL